jgi:hypothetical protein
MPSAWVEWIRKFAADNNTTYGCALSNPKCSATYRRWKQKQGMKLTKKDKEKIEGEEMEQMGGEDVNVSKKGLTAKQIKKAEYNRRFREKQKAKRDAEV